MFLRIIIMMCTDFYMLFRPPLPDRNVLVRGLRIDSGGLSVNCCALFREVPTKCSLAN